MIGNTGTYLDSPYHRYEGGTDLASLDLATLVDLPAEVFHLTDVAPGGSGPREIPAAIFQRVANEGRDLAGSAVLLHTGWSSLFGTPAYAHRGLLAAGIHVVEHLTDLGALPPSGARFTAVPPAVERFGTFPVRAFATVP